MAQLWSLNYISQLCKLKLLFWTCSKFWEIFVLIDSYPNILLNIFYHRSLYSELYFLILSGDCGILFFKEKFSKSSYICVFFKAKASNFCNWGLVDHRKLHDPLMINIFDVLLISLLYTLSFKWSTFGLKYLVAITPKGQFLKFKAILWNFSIFQTDKNCDSLFNFVCDNSVSIMER